MCGFVSCDLNQETAAIRTGLERNRSKLACVANGAGSHVTDPSRLAPGLAAFDTEHARAAAIAASTIKLGHLFLVIAAEAPAVRV